MRAFLNSRVMNRLILLCLGLSLNGCSGGTGWSALLRPDIFTSIIPDGISAARTDAVAPHLEEKIAVAAVAEIPSVAGVSQAIPDALPPSSAQFAPTVAPGEPANIPEPLGASGERRLAASTSPDLVYGTQLLAQDVNWRGEVLITGVLTLASQATLTIEPGTVVRFGSGGTAPAAEAMLLVYGRIVAQGTQEKPIIFSSIYAEPRGGDWRGLVLLGSEKKNLLDNCQIMGAATGVDASFSTIEMSRTLFTNCVTGVYLQDALIIIDRGGAEGCETGMVLVDSEATLRDTVFSGNNTGITSEHSSLYVDKSLFSGNKAVALHSRNSRLKISGGRFVRNGAGLTVLSSQGSLSASTVAENGGYGLSLTDSRMKVHSNNILSNGAEGIKVENGGGAAWGNVVTGNGGCDIANAGTKDFRAIGNWFGAADATGVSGRICERDLDGRRGRILHLPVLSHKPATLP